MKTGIHPTYYKDCRVTCACGNTFTTGSTKPEIRVEICSACHPFFTGKMKFVDTLGRVEKFAQRMQQAQAKKYLKKSKRKQLKEKEEKQRPVTLKEMLSKKP
ncbi:50S ribosomal protein L31 [Candidatus Beckwithbacteria bacterium CG22_combo_CG10-13_8_21_14_all_01_47_9]|uniref:Large ribosomal subunit protein bL31 n=5 Tax=Candidatus Beckwithiibacteriota TaxID=1752726 RepID=A0A2H0DZU1_9BACT|nr:MAG: 50S ribosomal protein L31 [Candidatus Beckwithbacteria bacterium CG1_02_47_37]PIP52473.1 MAG: 50S ribosomal protein L31 [Candidatus Beckwithbacteria bacterium CG23_combo_of_CG06-09_8_20_14_all_47_9]PIP87692.1 MAG: 50S ribosomal protein L31 [Candidatus Beckwithbacteria bacterium CG22_combo_CG10-13_8_21_14_all_01_47_9]PJA22157.1 MAG: 50S ribosomal protein L31 [Candidatus Beckwithbacteria bacterium CG_4_10_14_0_2_um_filter_47_25]PJC66397.1 MAG: 50S ribosomal protein L31 [Candidatus Beckwit